MLEHETRLNAEAVTRKWQNVIESGRQLTDADLFNLGLAIFQSRTRGKRSTSDGIRLFSYNGDIIIDYFPENQNSPEAVWIETPEDRKTVTHDIRRTGDVYRVFSIDLENGTENPIFLTAEEKLELTKELVRAHQITLLKHKKSVSNSSFIQTSNLLKSP